jgi:hypothetical protein
MGTLKDRMLKEDSYGMDRSQTWRMLFCGCIFQPFNIPFSYINVEFSTANMKRKESCQLEQVNDKRLKRKR